MHYIVACEEAYYQRPQVPQFNIYIYMCVYVYVYVYIYILICQAISQWLLCGGLCSWKSTLWKTLSRWVSNSHAHNPASTTTYQHQANPEAKINSIPSSESFPSRASRFQHEEERTTQESQWCECRCTASPSPGNHCKAMKKYFATSICWASTTTKKGTAHGDWLAVYLIPSGKFKIITLFYGYIQSFSTYPRCSMYRDGNNSCPISADDSWRLWRPRSLTTPDDSWRPLTTPDDPWRPLTTPDDPWRPLTTPDDPWRPLTTPDDSWRPLTTPDDPWRPLTTPDDSWRLLTTPDDSWRPLTTPDDPWRPLTTPDDPWRPLTTPDDSWRLLTTPDDPWRPLTTPDDPWRPLTTPDDPWRPLTDCHRRSLSVLTPLSLTFVRVLNVLVCRVDGREISTIYPTYSVERIALWGRRG